VGQPVAEELQHFGEFGGYLQPQLRCL
jgi:hypothetical protein